MELSSRRARPSGLRHRSGGARRPRCPVFGESVGCSSWRCGRRWEEARRRSSPHGGARLRGTEGYGSGGCCTEARSGAAVWPKSGFNPGGGGGQGRSAPQEEAAAGSRRRGTEGQPPWSLGHGAGVQEVVVGDVGVAATMKGGDAAEDRWLGLYGNKVGRWSCGSSESGRTGSGARHRRGCWNVEARVKVKVWVLFFFVFGSPSNTFMFLCPIRTRGLY
ncbi:proline-rich receptor-like protein kinase PERK2 [Iris pallida]|uniref:Mucin-5AC-like isoform X4 n=1 Tax=Iris pallida TaxID=29817 RepID=A0AAX6G211_IRIPA|nr:mucin-5AC-like isoform X4 [Iris pallida]KAJ6822749.1 proline-rich receptor-like protein kinase PERK2 [Iris pallida]